MPSLLSLLVETKTQSLVVDVGCLSPHLGMPLVGVSPLVSFLVPFFAPPLGPSCLLASYAHAGLIGSSARLSSSAHRFALCLVSPGSPPHSTSETGRHDRRVIIGVRAWSWMLACLGWRRAAGGHRRRMAAGGGCGCGCLLASE